MNSKEIKLQALKEGNFTNVDLNEWFLNKNDCYEYVYAALEGLDKRINVDLLTFITTYVNHYLNYFQDNNDSINYVLFKRIMGKIIYLCSEHGEYYGLTQQFYKHPNEDVRLYCAGTLNYASFFTDPSERVRKVANMCNEYINNYRRLSDSEREIINYLAKALEFKSINISFINGYPTFSSLLFQKDFAIISLDNDIFYIKDKHILAFELYKYIIDNKIAVNLDMFPEVFNKLQRSRNK